ncbi:LapA family protein [Novosphingobium sp. 1949]|uniref:LapA family protein n=1 Tax=Novosphingobium organovorum TaxID=2930092 RepID=A0ABT0B993_9SPHN|nr:LapA family protein [Novosphingobium organovorum]MCJ2181364.1 LapA family protein [Novosphingobium organovorum]
MKAVRTLTWILVTAILVAFIAMNWTKVAVNFWPLDDGNYIHFEWPVGFVAFFFFLLGTVPVWLYFRAVRWRLNRRITSLENSLRATSMSPLHDTSDAPAAPAPAAASEPVADPLPLTPETEKP